MHSRGLHQGYRASRPMFARPHTGSCRRSFTLWTEGVPLDAHHAAWSVTGAAKNFGHVQVMRMCIDLQQLQWLDVYQDVQVGLEIGHCSARIMTPLVW